MLPRPRLAGKIRRPQLRTQVLAGVLLVTLAALAVFDVTAVSELRRYLLSRTDSNLRTVIDLAQPVPKAVYSRVPPHVSVVGGGRSTPAKQVARSIKFSAPHLKLRPAFLDQYYLAFVGKRGVERVFIEGNPYLIPRQLHAIKVAQSWQVISTGVSDRGNTPLRLWARPIAGGTLVASTSIGDVDRTVGRLRLILIIGSVGAGLLVAAASFSCCGAGCGRSR